MSKSVVIPKYGFPVDVVDLNILKNNVLEKDFEPSRDLSVAISEYAPESEVIIKKKKYVSRYINLPYNDITKLPTRYYIKCDNCKRITTSLDETSDNLIKCLFCGEEINEKHEQYIIPKLGFTTEHNEIKSSYLKPKKTFSSPTYYLGGGISNRDEIIFGQIMKIESSKNDELISLNENPLYVCPYCGYTIIVKDYKNTPYLRHYKDKKKHAKRLNEKDLCFNLDLKRRHLAHVFSTDALKITIARKFNEEEALSFLYALLDGISLTFNIERNDINGVYSYESNYTQIILFDKVPGDAGHVKRILSKEAIIQALKTAFIIVDRNCCEETSSCYDCLRNYYNQIFHEKLKRGHAKRIISEIIDLIGVS